MQQKQRQKKWRRRWRWPLESQTFDIFECDDSVVRGGNNSLAILSFRSSTENIHQQTHIQMATHYTYALYGSNSTWLDLTRLDSTHHIRRVEPMHFGCVELVEQHSSTRSTRRARLARHVELDWLDTSSSTGATCNLVMITVINLLFNKLFTD